MTRTQRQKNLTKAYRAWLAGMPKWEAEETILGVQYARGKTFSRRVRDELGIETEDVRSLVKENQALKLSANSFQKYLEL